MIRKFILFAVWLAVGSAIIVPAFTQTYPGQFPPVSIYGNATTGEAVPTPVLPPLARSSLLLNIDQLATTGDVNYTIKSTDRVVAHTALSTARTDTLPSAAALNAGQHIIETDIYAVATASNTITLTRAASDTINGATSIVAINVARGGQDCISDGVSKWICNPLGPSAASGVSSLNSQTGVVTIITGSQLASLTSSDTIVIFAQPTTSVPGDIRNLKITQGSTTTLSVGFDQVITEAGLNGVVFQEGCPSGCSHTLTITNTGANGMDAGSAPTSGFICVYSITKGDGSTFSVLGVNAATNHCPTIYPGANMPSGYTASGLIGIWPTDGSAHVIAGTAYGRKFYYDAPRISQGATTGPSTLTSISIAGGVPFEAKTVDILAFTTNTSASVNWAFAGDANGASLRMTTAIVSLGSAVGTPSATQATTFNEVVILTSQTIFWAEYGARTADAFDILGYGF